MSSRNLRKRVAVAAVWALLLPVASGGLLAGASALAQNGDITTSATKTPKPAPTVRHRTLASLGRASAVAWIRVGHVGH